LHGSGDLLELDREEGMISGETTNPGEIRNGFLVSIVRD
jgi:hypothetical protein